MEQSGRIIALCNQKGGVGKTTTSINLACALALEGTRVLIVDLDPQGNATGGLGIDKRKLTHSVYDLLLQQKKVDEVVIPSQVAGLDIIPSKVELSGAEVELVGLPEREGRLRNLLETVRPAYEVILVDTPPSLGLLTVNALVAADGVLIPLQCEYYALEGLSQLLETIRLVQGGMNPGLVIEGILLTMADFRTKLTADVIQETRNFFGSKVFDIVVPRSIRLSEAPSRGLPIALYDSSSSGAEAYKHLGELLRTRYGWAKAVVEKTGERI